MIGLEFSRDMNPLSNQVDACRESVHLRSSGQSKHVFQSCNIKLQRTLTLGEGPVRIHDYLGC